MIPNICIRGSEDDGATVIRFLESLGGINVNNLTGKIGDWNYSYFINSDGYISGKYGETYKRKITLREAHRILEGKAKLTEDGLVVYDKLPRTMWAWNDDPDEASQKEIHACIKTLNNIWIDSNGNNWKNASDTDPRTPHMTIQEAEKKFNIKIIQ